MDALALNAGRVVGGPFLETDLERDLALIQLNIGSAVHLAKRLLPAMVSRGEGRVLITSSIAAGDDKVVAGSVKNLPQTIAARLAPEQSEAARHAVYIKPEDLEEE